MNMKRLKLNVIATAAIGCGVGMISALSTAVVHASDDAAPLASITQSETAAAAMGASGNGGAGVGRSGHHASASRVSLDRSGKSKVGTASFYSSHYAGKTMADGKPMRLYSNNAASLTLPLGSTATVTNLDTGRTAKVTIQDRGPYARGRIIDLSPATAHLIGITTKQGLAKVQVTPLTVPQLDGSVWHSAPTLARNN